MLSLLVLVIVSRRRKDKPKPFELFPVKGETLAAGRDWENPLDKLPTRNIAFDNLTYDTLARLQSEDYNCTV